MRKPAVCICENKDADQLRGECAADQRLCFRYTGVHSNRLGKVVLMSTHNICFYEDLTKITFQLLSNIIKYAPYLFFFNIKYTAQQKFSTG